VSGAADPTEDFVASVLEAIGQHIKLAPEQALRIEERLRADYGGERVYIHREGWFDRAQRDAKIRAERQAGRSIRWLAGHYSLGVATVHEILNGGR
jgi:Mor family transcriptional regulator